MGEALDYALSKKDLSTKTMQGYRGQLNYIKETADKTGHGLLTLDQVDRGVLLDLLDECARDRSFSNHAYNKYSGTLRAMFVELVNYRVIDFNPLRDLREKTIPESNFYATFTAAEKVRITEYLSTTHRPLFVVMSAIYHTGIRPKEMLALRIRDVDLKGQMITIAPDLVAENSKTTNVRRVPINTHLLGLLKSMHLSKYPGEYFLFGSPFIPGQGNRGSGSRMVNGKRITGAMRPDFLTPHTTPVDRDTITKLWKRLIIDGLGINKHLYAAKHTGTDDKVEAGLDLADIQYLYGHKSEAMTERYNKKKRELQARKELLDKSPAFSNGTILKKVS
ncbi:MAG TPA: site-specific integrase [Chitinophagaceae bacterium]|nr:site-specific integrase [Chitinophagaceae bacterium]